MAIFDYRRKIWKEVLDFVETLKGKTLDAGCGNGDVTRLIKGAIGLDASEELLEIARSKSKNKFVKGKCEEMPFEDGEFNNVLLTAVLHNLRKVNRKKCLSEIFRVLKKNGRLFLSVWCKDHWVVKRKGKKLVRVFEKCKCGINYLKWGSKGKRYYYFFERKELINLLKSSGFEIKKFKKSGDNYFVECIKD